MTQTRRITLNIAATYLRSVYALAVGLLAGRWTLQALGQTDYGLMGVVGGLIGFVTFFNGLFSVSIGFYYAKAVGAAKVADSVEKGLEECRRWFNVALGIHTALPIVLVLIGYPIGAWAVRDFLTIPPDRVEACVWVWRFVCAGCFVGMVNVPFGAMYSAKQEIAELTVYSFVTTTVNFFFLMYMVNHPGVWLAKYACFTAMLGIVPQLIIAVRAVFKYPECRLNFSYMIDIPRFKQLTVFVGSQLWTAITGMINQQSQGILINKIIGPIANAAVGIGSSVAGHVLTFSGSLWSAFNPAVANAAGAKQWDQMRKMAFMANKLGGLFILVFAIPLVLEIHEVLVLWLKNPPLWAAEFCTWILVAALIEKMSDGFCMGIISCGGLPRYSLTVGWFWLGSIGLFYLSLKCGYGVVGIGVTRAIAMAMAVVIRVAYGRKYAGMSPRYYLMRILLPTMVLIVCAAAGGLLPRLIMAPSFIRVVATTIATEVVFIPLVWFLLLSDEERVFVLNRIPKWMGGRK